MTAEDREFLNQINTYAEEVMADVDPQKVRISEQLDMLRPILQKLAIIHSMPAEDVFLKYMDLAAEAAGYDFIVLDFRSNYGGGNYQQYLFFDNLYKSSYSGTIYVTQDNWSYSSGEVWIIANRFKDKLNLKLIGTHSGGMQIYGNCVKYNENGIYF